MTRTRRLELLALASACRLAADRWLPMHRVFRVLLVMR
jgi:hypothetical protein